MALPMGTMVAADYGGGSAAAVQITPLSKLNIERMGSQLALFAGSWHNDKKGNRGSDKLRKINYPMPYEDSILYENATAHSVTGQENAPTMERMLNSPHSDESNRSPTPLSWSNSEPEDPSRNLKIPSRNLRTSSQNLRTSSRNLKTPRNLHLKTPSNLHLKNPSNLSLSQRSGSKV
ncbi:hypothetical protein BDZ91DRAFT_761073 [Kalaharituber pfeilii]|nr:hypothetical protein BDZ91DRAFT_761073 [Kalaharituber pfeilii]